MSLQNSFHPSRQAMLSYGLSLNGTLPNALRRLPLIAIRVRSLPRNLLTTALSPFSCCVDFEPMDPNTQQQGGQENDTPWLSAAIKAMDFAEKATSFVPPAKIVFYTVSAILQTINVCFVPHCLCYRFQVDIKRTGL